MIKNDNELIAKFMGYSQPHPSFENTTYWFKEFEPPLVMLLYHVSWDHLMGVVDVIENLDLRNNGHDFPKVKMIGDHCEIFCYAKYRGTSFYWKKWCSIDGTYSNHMNQTETKLDAVYSAVIEFIKWYNQNQTK